MHAILTKFIGPTNYKGSRVKASVSGYAHRGEREPSITIGYGHAQDEFGNHLGAAKALCKKMGWKGTLHSGSTRAGYVFVFRTKVSDGMPIHGGTTVAV